jgi:class 3 adenylate cyclase
MVLDLRNFTPNLNGAGTDERGINEFCHFLSSFYALVLDACLMAVPPSERDAPPFHITSTGDGALVVFLDEQWHHGHAYLAALILHHTLHSTCRRYNATLAHPLIPHTAFGIGVESGTVSRVSAQPGNRDSQPVIDTYIGHCINVAARAQELTKQLHHAPTIIGAATNTLLVRGLLDQDYDRLTSAVRGDVPDDVYLELVREMRELNEALCMVFVHLHKLRGVHNAMPLFRVSVSAARLANQRFLGLLDALTRGDVAHRQQIVAVLGTLTPG